MGKNNIEQFAQKISKILPQVIRWFHMNRANAMIKSQLNPAQFFVLDMICEKGPQKMSDLAKGLKVSLPAVTKIVDKLCAMKMVERIHGRQDRRVIRIDILAKGRKIVNLFAEQRNRAFVEMFAQLNEKDRQDYLRVITKIRNIAYQTKGETKSVYNK